MYMSEWQGDTCTHVEDGDTFSTRQGVWIRLARVNAPEKGEPNFNKAEKLLSDLILNKIVVYKQVGTSFKRIVAEVTQDGNNINDIMRRAGYS